MFSLNKTVLRVVTRLNNAYPYDVEVEKIKSGNSSEDFYDLIGGFAAHLLLELSKYLDFTFELLDDPTLTYRFDQATNLSVDLFAASFVLTEVRGSILDPTFATGTSKLQVFLNREFERSMHDTVLQPFHTSVWLFIGLLILIFSLSIGISTFMNENINFADGVFQIIAASTQQDCNIIFEGISSRTIMWTTSITYIILLAAYSGKVVSFNAVKKYAIDSFEKVVASDYDMNFDVGFDNGSAYQGVAEALNTTPVMERFFKKVIKSSFKYQDFETSFKRVEEKPFAYVIDEETGYAYVEERLGFFPCEYARISFQQVKFPWVMFMPKGSKFRPAINYGIQKLQETGHLRRLVRRWVPGTGSTTCTRKYKENVSSIHLTQLRSSFIILAAGVTFAFSAFFLEHSMSRNMQGGSRLVTLTYTTRKLRWLNRNKEQRTHH